MLLRTLRKSDPNFIIKGKSWSLKKFHTVINLILQFFQYGIYFGQFDIRYSALLEWLMIANVVLYFFSFRIDFKKAEMGVQVDEWSQQQINQPVQPISYQMGYYQQ
jgi:hypothetical protein